METLIAAAVVVAAAPAAEDTRPRFRVLLLAAGQGGAPIVDAVALRLPDLSVKTSWDLQGSKRPEDHVFAEVRRDADVLTLRVVLADGQAFLRPIEVDTDQPRALATTLANLLWAVEHGHVAPDETDQPMPATEPDPEPEPDPDPDPDPVSDPDPVPEPDRTRRLRSADKEPAASPPTWTVGPVLAPGILFALGPPSSGGAVAAGGPTFGVDVRSPKGLLVMGQVRPAWRLRGNTAVGRVGIAAGVGYHLRRGPFVLTTGAMIGLEPWWINDGGDRSGPRSIGAPPVLLVAGLRATPGAAIDVRRGPLRLVTFGLRVDAWGGLAFDDGAHVPGVERDGDDLFRLGGFELWFGPEVALHFAVDKSR